MKTLSIIVPTYNVEKYLKRCLDSILLDEIVDDLEVIIINDGGKDNSIKIANEYKSKYSNSIIVIDKENGGHGSTINRGVQEATGKYIKILDSDDWVNIDDFPSFVKKLKEIDCDLVLTNFRREMVFSGESAKFKYNKMKYNRLYKFDDFEFKNLGLDYFTLATSTFKTDILKKVPEKLDEKTFYVDMEFVIFPIPYINDFMYLDYDIYRYYIGRADQSVNATSMVKNRNHHEKVLKRLIKFYNELKASEVKKKYIKNIITQMLNTHYIIFCSYSTDNEGKKQIKEFDDFLKNTNKELYNEMNNFAYIRWNRRTHFRHSSTKKHLLTRFFNAYEYKILCRRSRKEAKK